MTLNGAIGHTDTPTWMIVSPLGRLRVATSARVIWLQVRGCSRIDSMEGSFVLERGEWIAIGAGTLPELQCEEGALALGLVVPQAQDGKVLVYRDYFPNFGRGTLLCRQLRLAIRIWREAAQQEVPEESSAYQFLLSLFHLQQELAGQVSRCPGRSLRRRRELFDRLQRAKLYLDGNSHRMVRVTELAEVAGCSIWYLCKLFLCVYGANPQSIAGMYRLERARRLLTSTALGISEISRECGFTSHAAFARAFQHRHGMSATKYRAQAVGIASMPAKNRTPDVSDREGERAASDAHFLIRRPHGRSAQWWLCE